MPGTSTTRPAGIALRATRQQNRHLLFDPSLTDATPWLRQLTSPWECLDNREPVQSSAHTAVYRGTLGGITVYLKQFFDRGRTDAVKNLFRPHRAIRALRNDQQLREAGFSAPLPVVFGYRHSFFGGRDYVYVTQALEGYRDLYTLADNLPSLHPARRIALIRDLALTIGNLHRQGFFHGDLRPGNVLVRDTDTPDIALLDNERTRHYRRLPTHQRIKNLTQLNMLLSPSISVRHRLYFFAVYCRVAGIQHRDQLLHQVAAKTRRRLSRMVSQGRIDPAQLSFLEQSA